MAHKRVDLPLWTGASNLRVVGTIKTERGVRLGSWITKVAKASWYTHYPSAESGHLNLTTLIAKDQVAAALLPIFTMTVGDIKLFLWGPGTMDDGFLTRTKAEKLKTLDRWANNEQYIAPKEFTEGLWQDAREVLVYQMNEEGLFPETEEPIGPKKPPKTIIVQEWAVGMEEKEPGEIARRAWEATIAASRGEAGSRS